VLVMDSTETELSGTELVREVHRKLPRLRIAVFGMNEDMEVFLTSTASVQSSPAEFLPVQ
jgi:hypothetical protein